MRAGKGGMLPGDRDVPDLPKADRNVGASQELILWPVVPPVPVPPSMTADLARLRAAFPGFSIGIRPGWRGLTFEAWRDPTAGGLCAVITPDADELRRELDATQGREGFVAGNAGSSLPEGGQDDDAPREEDAR
jgi:hypothetical protein